MTQLKKLIISFFFIAFTNIIFSETLKISINRIEPSSWWIGMNNKELQLLIYGKNIGITEPSINIPGIKITNICRTKNSNYLFLYLYISDDTKAGNYEISFFLNKKNVAKANFQLFQRKQDSQIKKSFTSSDVIYLLMPDRFSNGNPLNDATSETFEKPNRSNPNGRHGGDIEGIIDHLDYLKELGITTIWSTPLLEDNMNEYSYHTYAITDYYKIDPRYGKNEDYKRLADELHKRNMKLIFDLVTNHCGYNHWWIKDLPDSTWIHQFDKFTRTNYQVSTLYDPYASDYDKNICSNGWFDNSMPDLNQNNSHLLKYLTQNIIWWIEYAGIDGIRIDTYPYNDKIAMNELLKSIIKEYPTINIVGECWVSTPQEISYWQKGAINKDGYSSELPAVMDFPLMYIFHSAFNEDDSWNSGLRRFYNHFTLDFIYPNPNNILIFFENHDTPRFNELVNGDIRKTKMAYSLLLTIRGIPQIYYGTEILMRGDKNKGDGDIRRDFPGGWPNDNRNAFSEEGRTKEENELFNYVKKILNWRINNEVIHTGKTVQYLPENNIYVFFRCNDNKTVMVITNNHNTEKRKVDLSRYCQMIKNFSIGYDIITNEKIKLDTLQIEPKTVRIIELE